MEEPSQQDKQPTYDEAYQELERIMEALKEEEVPIEELASKVERASYLIKICSAKLRGTEDRIKDVLEDLQI